MIDGEFNHPRLVAVYDAEFPWAECDDLFLAMVREAGGDRVLDLGCGTGRLTLGLAAAGFRVTGVDPSGVSLAAARAKPDADRVTWLQGSAEVLPERSFDVAVMSGHVAQFLVAEAEWRRVLRRVRRSLRPGGVLVFDSRDPADRGWERWNPIDSRRSVRLPDGTGVVVWTEVTAVDGQVVTFERRYRFPDHELRSVSRMRFRSHSELRDALRDSGFQPARTYGGWARQPVGAGDGELIVVARAAPAE